MEAKFEFSLCHRTVKYIGLALETEDGETKKELMDTALGHEIRCRLVRGDGSSTEATVVIRQIALVTNALEEGNVTTVTVSTSQMHVRRN